MAKEVKKKDNKKEEKAAKTNSNTMRSELKKVTWPTRKELVNSTIAVIVIVIIVAIIVFLADLVFEGLNTYGIDKVRSIVSNSVNKDDNKNEATNSSAQEVVIDNLVVNEAGSTEVNNEVDAKITMSSRAIKNNYFNYLNEELKKYEDSTDEVQETEEPIDNTTE